jgi:multiple sugar transport system permease protein
MPENTNAKTPPAQTGTLPEQTGMIPAQAGTVPERTGTIPEQAGMIPAQTGTIPAGRTPPARKKMSPAGRTAPARKKMSPAKRKRALAENLWGYGFISVNLIWILAFTLYPLLFSLGVSFQKWNPIMGGTFIGLGNFARAVKDNLIRTAMGNNVRYAAWTILGGFVFSYGAAIAVSALPIKKTLRFLYFIPSICSTIMVSMIWSYLLQPQTGLVNTFLKLLGVSGPPSWLSDPFWAPVCLYAIVVWANLGYWMVVFLTGLMDIPETYYQAAKIDGAGAFKRFFHITIPLTTPIIFFYLSMALITCWGQFDMAVTLASYSGGQAGGAGPQNSLLFPASVIYRTAFASMDFGYSASMGWLLTVFILALAFANSKLSKRWVFYDK